MASKNHPTPRPSLSEVKEQFKIWRRTRNSAGDASIQGGKRKSGPRIQGDAWRKDPGSLKNGPASRERPKTQRRNHGSSPKSDVSHTQAHLRVVADYEGRLSSIRGGAPRSSRPAHGHALCASVASVPVSGSGAVGCARSDTAATRAARREKGKKRATCREARSALSESRRISERNWLLGLDSNQQPSG